MTGLMQENLIWFGFCVKHLLGLVRTMIKVGQVKLSSVNWLPLKILDSSLSATVLCIIGPFF